MKKNVRVDPGLGVCVCDFIFASAARCSLRACVLLIGVALAMIGAGCGGGSSGTTQNLPVSVAVSAAAKLVQPGASVQITATVLNDLANQGVTWAVSCSGSDCGAVSPTSGATQTTYTAPSTAPTSPLTVTITATSVTDGSKTASTAVTIAFISVSVSPASATVAAGGTQAFSATVTGDPGNAGVTWAVSCNVSTCGTVSPTTTASGATTNYTAPATLPIGDLAVALVATAVSNTAVSNSAQISVPGFTILVTPNPATVTAGTTAQFTATVANDASHSGVAWTVQCPTASCGSVSPTTTASGAATTYTAPAAIPAGDLQVTLTATSVGNAAVFGDSFVTVPGINISLAQDSSTVDAGGSTQVTATVTNDTPNKGVAWSLTCGPGPCGAVSPTATASGVATTYTAPANPPPDNLSVSITATSVTNTDATSAVTVTVPAITVSVAPGSALLPENATQDFTATVAHDPAHAGVTWVAEQSAVCSPACGNASPSSTASGTPTTFTAPGSLPTSPMVTLTATSVTDTSKTSNAGITISTGTVKLVPSVLNLGTVVQGGTSTAKSTAMTNTGASVLSISGITITGTNPTEFFQTNTCGTALGAGASCTITVTFKPTEIGGRTAMVSIADNSTDSPQQITIQGTGKQRPRISAAVRSALTENAALAAPAPTGTESVGTRVVKLVDSGRVDPYLNNGSKRELLVRFWYPAAFTQTCRPAEYTSPAVWNYFSRLMEVPLPKVTTNSCWETPVLPGTHPVVVFSPGYTATFTDYTFLFEDLASRGYIVASVDHTYEATAVEFPDGKFAESMVGSHLGETLRGDDKSTSFAIYVRLGDLRFVVDELERLNIEGNSPFAGRLDVSRVGVAGHSMGGLSAFLIAEHDARLKSAVLLDAVVPTDLVAGTEKPMLVLRTGSETPSPDDCHLWRSLRGPRIAVNVTGSEHVTPSDAVWLVRNAIETGNMGADKSIAAVRDYVAAFLDAHLRGRTEERLLSGASAAYPEVAVTTEGQTACSQR